MVWALSVCRGFSWDNFPLSSRCFGFSRRMMITLMFSVVATKSRTLSSSLYSANEQVSRSWEGTQPSRLPNWPMDIFRTIDVTVSLGMGVGRGAGSSLLFSFLWVEILSCLEVWIFFPRSLVFSGSFAKFCKISEFQVPWSLLRDWVQFGLAVEWWELYCI